MNIQQEVMGLVRQACAALGTPEPPGVGLDKISALEGRMGMQLPNELSEWLRVCNAPNVGPGGLLGISPDFSFLDIEAHYNTRQEWRAKRWIPVAGDGCGDFYVLDAGSNCGETHPVYFVDQSDYCHAAYIVASGLWRFLRFLLINDAETERGGGDYWPFDRERVLAEDPDILRYRGQVRLPWVADEECRGQRDSRSADPVDLYIIPTQSYPHW